MFAVKEKSNRTFNKLHVLEQIFVVDYIPKNLSGH